MNEYAEEVTPRELLDDAAKIGGWIRELRSLEWQEHLIFEQVWEEEAERFPFPSRDEGEAAQKAADQRLTIIIGRRVRAERGDMVERILFLRREVEAALARGRLVECAAVAERYVG